MRIPYRARFAIALGFLLLDCKTTNEHPASSLSPDDSWDVSEGPKDEIDWPSQGWPCGPNNPCLAPWFCSAPCGEMGRCALWNDCPTGIVGPVCGCDGKIYADQCDALTTGVMIGGKTCVAPREFFWCGTGSCQKDVEVCMTYNNGEMPHCTNACTDPADPCGCIDGPCSCTTNGNGETFVDCIIWK